MKAVFRGRYFKSGILKARKCVNSNAVPSFILPLGLIHRLKLRHANV